jgi:simple sugar transport system permease protein
MNLPVHLVVEKRSEDYPKWLPAATSLAAVLLAFVISGIILTLIGGDPILVGKFFWSATFGSIATISDTLVKATPLILVGLACAVAFRMKLWNIGAEGQFYMGAFFASLVVLIPVLPPDAPKPLVLFVMAIMGMIGGAIWGFVPGFLKAKFAVSEIITTLMLNYVAILWNNFWIFDRWSEGGFQMTRLFERSYWLPRLADYARDYPALSGMTLHLGFIVALIAAFVVWWIFDRSRWGYEIKLIGDNPQAARYAGLNIARNIILVMVFSGALAGLAGMSEISGVVHRLQERISPGYGFTGIIIAWVAKLNPFAIVLVSVLFGALIVAGREIQPSGLAQLLQGIILFMVISSDVLLRYKIRLQRRATPVMAGSDA